MDNKHILETLLSIKDDLSLLSSELSVVKSRIEQHMKVEDDLQEKVAGLERQTNMAHGGLALLALIGTIAGIIKALS